jgi:ParB family chromosome partitioning protein
MQRRPAAQPDAAPAAPDAPSAVTIEFRRIPIDQLHESALNPRRRFHEDKLRRARRLDPDARRPDAAPRAADVERRRPGLRARGRASALPRGAPRGARRAARARAADDGHEFLEILTIENLQREDVHPLEEAQGFADLIKHAGYDVARIADRVGKSHQVRVRPAALLQLTPELQEIFFAARSPPATRSCSLGSRPTTRRAR